MCGQPKCNGVKIIVSSVFPATNIGLDHCPFLFSVSGPRHTTGCSGRDHTVHQCGTPDETVDTQHAYQYHTSNRFFIVIL